MGKTSDGAYRQEIHRNSGPLSSFVFAAESLESHCTRKKESLYRQIGLTQSFIGAARSTLSDPVLFCEQDGSFFKNQPLPSFLIQGDTSPSSIFELPGATTELIELIHNGYWLNGHIVNPPLSVRLSPYAITSRPIKHNGRFSPHGNLLVVHKLDEPNAASTEVPWTFETMVGKDPAFLDSKTRSTFFAATPRRILLVGASGTGKEVFAQAIHNASAKGKPFLKVNCPAITHRHAARFLAGYKEGNRVYPGALMRAAGGTLFLDNIDKLHPTAQAFLMQTLDSGQVLPIGSGTPVDLDFRLISTSSRDLSQELESGRLKGDYYYRFAHEVIMLPTLSERRCDILPMVDLFVDECCKNESLRPVMVSAEAKELLYAYSWPGNIREMKSAVKQACLTCENNIITVNDLSTRVRDKSSGSSELFTAKNREKLHIERAYQDANGNVALAAKALGISKATLYRKLKQFEISECKG